MHRKGIDMVDVLMDVAGKDQNKKYSQGCARVYFVFGKEHHSKTKE